MNTPAPGTVLTVGDPTPPTSNHKATAALLFGLIPVVLGGIIVMLKNATTLFAGGPTWVFVTAAILLIILGPVASYFAAYNTTNRLLVPVQIIPTTPPSAPEVPSR